MQLGASNIALAEPWWLLLLLALPVVALLRGKRRGAPAAIFPSAGVMKKLGRVRHASAGALLASLLYPALALLILALARPQRVSSIAERKASGIDILVAVDVSRSMLAEDFSVGGQRANRLEAIKQVTRDFITGRPNDRIGIVAFAGQPYLVSPLTLDHEWLLANLERLKIGLVEDGTAIGSAIASATNRLKDRDSKSKLLVLLTDGDSNAGRVPPKTAADAAAAVGVKIYTIGAGTRGMAPYPVGKDMFGELIYRNMQVEFNEESLKEIANVSGGKYFRAVDTPSLVEVFDQIDKLEKTVIETQQYRKFDELFAWLAAPGAFLLATGVALSQTVWRRIP